MMLVLLVSRHTEFGFVHPFYVGELNENLKFVIKNRNFTLLSCKVSVLQTACRMACRWKHSADA